MSDKMNHFFKELKNRKVYRVATVYAIPLLNHTNHILSPCFL